MATEGPKQLLRYSDGCLRLRDEGLELLRQAVAPIHVAFTIGGSRCGKSTACNALVFGSDFGEGRFQTGNSFDPVTTGIDVALRKLPEGGTLVVADCEGAFHISGSAQSARGFGTLGILAYCLGTVVLHTSMGSIDERDVEVLGHLAVSAEGLGASKPQLLLVVNGARFDLGDAVARRLLRPPEGAARGCARTAIAQGFQGQPALEALPACEHQAYWRKIDNLRQRIVGAPAAVGEQGLLASGEELSDRLGQIVSRLNGEAPETAVLREPQPAAEVLLRNKHLEPLVEELSKKFAAGATDATDPTTPPPRSRAASKSPSKLAMELVLAEFDERSASIGSEGSLRTEVVAEVRERLAARLSGISEALARGRKEARHTSQSPGAKEMRTPTPPCTPSGKKRALAVLQAAIEDTELRLSAMQTGAEKQIVQLRSALADSEDTFTELTKENRSEAQRLQLELQQFDQKWTQKLASERQGSSGAEAAAHTSLVELQAEMEDVQDLMPDVSSFGYLIDDLRSDLDEMQVAKRTTAEAATRRLDEHLMRLRSAWGDVPKLEDLRAKVSRGLDKKVAVFRAALEEETQSRLDRHKAMTLVVERMTASLDATVDADFFALPSSCASTPAAPLPSSCASTPAPVRRPLTKTPSMPSRWKLEKQRPA